MSSQNEQSFEEKKKRQTDIVVEGVGEGDLERKLARKTRYVEKKKKKKKKVRYVFHFFPSCFLLPFSLVVPVKQGKKKNSYTQL